MAGKREKPEEIVSKLRQVELLQGQGAAVAEAALRNRLQNTLGGSNPRTLSIAKWPADRTAGFLFQSVI